MTIGNLTRWVRGLEQSEGRVLYLRSEVAKAVSVGVETIRQFREADPAHLGPSFSGTFRSGTGPGREVGLYTPEDVARIETHLKRLRDLGLAPGSRGRRRVWTAAERADRHRLSRRETYFRHQAEALTNQGRYRDAAKAIGRADELGAELLKQEVARHEQLRTGYRVPQDEVST